MAALLRDHIIRGTQEPFVWGHFDCSLFSADWIKLVCGVDPMMGWRGTYHNLRGWLRIRNTLDAGLGGAADAAIMSLGWRRIDPALAQPGAVGVIMTDEGEAMSVRGDTHWLYKGIRGLWRVETAIRGWECR